MDYLLVAVIGLIIGAIINYFADVLPSSPGLTHPTCPECQTKFSLKDYLLRYQCSQCGAGLSLRHPLVLICSAAISILVRIYPPALLSYWATLPILILLGTIFVIDLEHHAILVKTTAVGFVLFLIYGVLLFGWKKALLGGLGGLAITLFFYFLGIAVSKVVGLIRQKNISEVAFGLGDVTAATILGFLVGWPSIVGVIVIAIVSFAVVSFVTLMVLILTKKYSAFANALPFAPFLILGVVVIYYL